MGEITFFFFFRPNLRPLSAFEVHKYLKPQEEKKSLWSKECGANPSSSPLTTLNLRTASVVQNCMRKWGQWGLPLRELHLSDQKSREEEVLEAKECGGSHWEQRIVEMDPLILCLNQYRSELHVCGMDPKKHSKGFEAWPSPRLISKWCMCREDSKIIATVLKTELILDSQPTFCGQELPVCT